MVCGSGCSVYYSPQFPGPLPQHPPSTCLMVTSSKLVVQEPVHHVAAILGPSLVTANTKMSTEHIFDMVGYIKAILKITDSHPNKYKSQYMMQNVA